MSLEVSQDEDGYDEASDGLPKHFRMGDFYSVLKAEGDDRSEEYQEIMQSIADEQDTSKDFQNTRKEGWAQRIVRSKKFEPVTLNVILLNTLWIGIELSFNKNSTSMLDSPPFFIIFENLFTLFFVGEIITRFSAFAVKSKGIFSFTYLFDSALVLLMVFEVWALPLYQLTLVNQSSSPNLKVFSILRLFRLSRVVRLVQSMKSIPEIVTLFRAVATAIRSVSAAFVLLMLATYVYAILFAVLLQTVGENDYEDPEVKETAVTLQAHYGTVGNAMLRMFATGILIDDATGELTLFKNGPKSTFPLLFLYLFFILLAAFTILNMLIGIMCEVITTTTVDQSTNFQNAGSVELIKSAFNKVDLEKNGILTREKFLKLFEQEEMLEAISDLNLDPTGIETISDVILKDQNIHIRAFLEMIVTGNRPIYISDLERLKLNFASKSRILEGRMEALLTYLDHQLKDNHHLGSLPSLQSEVSSRRDLMDQMNAQLNNLTHRQKEVYAKLFSLMNKS